MNLTREQLIGTLLNAGIPVARQNLFAPDEIGGDVFGTVSAEWVGQVYAAAIDALPANLSTVRDIGGGKTVRVPRYLLNGFCCRGAALYVYAFGMMGLAEQAALSSTPLDHDALAFGFLHYTAEPRTENLGRNGRHEQLWFIDHAGTFQTYEPGDGAQEPFTPTELASITLIFAQ